MDEVTGDGHAELLEDGSVEITFTYHNGDEAILKATRDKFFNSLLGLALMSKYQAALFCVSALLVLSCTKLGRHQLRTPGPWAAGAFASLGLVPVILWNLQHDWTSFAFQSSRAIGPGDHLIYPTNLAVTLLGQAAYLWPPAWLAAMACLWRASRPGVTAPDRFFLLLSVVPIAFFDLVALFSPHSLPHWSMSGFLFAFPLVGDWCSQLSSDRRRWLTASFLAAAVAIPLLGTSFAVQARTAAFTRPFYERAPKFDVNWQLIDWSALRGTPGIQEITGDYSFVVAVNWMQAARVSYALGPDVPIEVLPEDPRHFQFLEDKRLSNRNRGFFVGAAGFSEEAAQGRAYRDALSRYFLVDGSTRHIAQRVAGFPIFDILIIPIARNPSTGQGGSQNESARP